MKDVKGYEGRYTVDEFGSIYSHISGKCIPRKSSNHGTGYKTIRLCASDNSVKTFRVHRLVAEAWIPRTDTAKNYVNHKDGNKHNNHVSNLEWCSSKENTAHAIKEGLLKLKGFDNPSAKLTEFQVSEMLDLVKQGLPMSKVCEKFSVNRNAGRKALNRVYGTGWQIHQKEQYRSKEC